MRYYNAQHHYFDPYLQVYPDKFEVDEDKPEGEFFHTEDWPALID